MTSHDIRKQFLDFFASKGHKIVPSAPLVNKTDPTLLFINSGMAPFKDFFLGNGTPPSPRIADTQKCLRVSGKHNDLEDVGMDGTHHTLFEMLGNWSFGDYFKEEAIAWSWELLTEVYKLPKDRLYATVFGGDEKENLAPDDEAKNIWLRYLPENQILYGNKKDNFWEMGDTGPCGPCSEIHVDLRPDAERAKVAGETLVNQDDPLVVEIWNNVFMQFERKADRSLIVLPAQHVDTGMGFERLCMVLQGKDKTYDTDVFTPFIQFIEQSTGKTYGGSYDRNAKVDIAMRVCADHIRAVAFVIADGQLPSNTGAGYVIRRILRRAVRYYFSFLDRKEPLMYLLCEKLAHNFKDVFPELYAQKDFVGKIILEEEKAFLRTLDTGLKRLEDVQTQNNILDGRTAFELFDTYGFPIDLTELILSERGISVDKAEFEVALQEQKTRSRAATAREVGDWTQLMDDMSVMFIGYDALETTDTQVVKYRSVTNKGQQEYQIVLSVTPFYPEGGGQVGDAGVLYFEGEAINVLDTKKENDLIIHFVDRLPQQLDGEIRAVVDTRKRRLTESNHSATHLAHHALRQVLGTHVAQKGSLNNEHYMRFDFSHFQKVSDEELAQIEKLVNDQIRQNLALIEYRDLPIDEARNSGAMMLFGEKYGERVRMIVFGESKELCGGTHVKHTGEIGLFKFVSESSVAAGVRRIEAVTGEGAEAYVANKLETLDKLNDIFKSPKDIIAAAENLQEDNRQLRKQVEQLYVLQAKLAKVDLLAKATQVDGLTVIKGLVEVGSAEALRNLASDLRKDITDLYAVLGAVVDGKPQLVVTLSDSAVAKGMNASQICRDLAKHIQGGWRRTTLLSNCWW